MRSVKFASFVLAGALAALPAGALEVTIDNQTGSAMALAFSYLSTAENEWVVEGWYNVPAQSRGRVDLPCENDIYYVYAEFEDGKKIDGGEGSLPLDVPNRNFFYKQKSVPTKYVRTVNFHRGRSNGNRAAISAR